MIKKLLFNTFFIFILFNVFIRQVGATDCSGLTVGGNYTVSSSCSFSGQSDGNGRTVAGVDTGVGTAANTAVLTVDTGASLTIPANQTLVAGSLTLSGTGTITMIDGALIKIGIPIWIIDADSDGYASSTTYSTSTPTNGRRRNLASSFSPDCDDGNAANNTRSITSTGSPTVTTSGSYTIYEYTIDGTFAVSCPVSLDVDYLVVGGGGGGGYGIGGGGSGGGAGGYVAGSDSLSPTTYNVTVGTYGGGSHVSTSLGGTGGQSIFNLHTANGGAGGRYSAGTGGNCGSGTTVYSGGAGDGTAYPGGGAGNAANGLPRTPSNGTKSGSGGSGVYSTITGTGAYYGGGGGGGVHANNFNPGDGGAGGGAQGGPWNSAGYAATANTGGGGGGASVGYGGNGGSGVVFIRFLTN
jgi:hypothetical protein